MKFRNYRVNSSWMKFEERLAPWYFVQLEKPVILYVVLPNTGTSYLSSSWAFYQMQSKHKKLRSSSFSINTKSASSSEWTTWISIGAHLKQTLLDIIPIMLAILFILPQLILMHHWVYWNIMKAHKNTLSP